MKFGPVSLDEAKGAILAHSVSLPDGRLRKGLVLDAVAIERLAAANVSDVTVARLEDGDVHEDAAAEQLARALVPNPSAVYLRLAPASTGRVRAFPI